MVECGLKRVKVRGAVVRPVPPRAAPKSACRLMIERPESQVVADLKFSGFRFPTVRIISESYKYLRHEPPQIV